MGGDGSSEFTLGRDSVAGSVQSSDRKSHPVSLISPSDPDGQIGLQEVQTVPGTNADSAKMSFDGF